jgi:cytoskeletal protein RodZ
LPCPENYPKKSRGLITAKLLYAYTMHIFNSALLKRLVIAAVVGFLGFQMLSAVADQLSPTNPTNNPEPTSTQAPAPTPSPETPTPTQSAAPTPSPTSSAAITYISVPTASPDPTYAETQSALIKMPATVPVDPRASSTVLPSIYLHSNTYLLACVDVTNARASTFAPTNTDTTTGSALFVGNNTSHLYLSGNPSQLMSVLNSGNGLRLISTTAANHISGARISVRLADLTAPSLNTDLCQGATTSASTSITTLGLDLNLQKAPLPLKSK